MMAMPPSAVNGISHAVLDSDTSLASPLSLTAVNLNQQGLESDVRHEPLRVNLDKLDALSTKPAVGTPLDPESLPIHPPKGTPPPPTGQLLEDVRMTEQESPSDTPNGINGHHDHHDIEMAPPVTNGIKRHSEELNVSHPSASPQQEQRSQSHLLTSQSDPLPSSIPQSDYPASESHLIRQPQAIDEDEDQPPPAKRARKLSDADAASVDHTPNGHTLSASPAPAPPTTAPSSPQSALSTISSEQHRFSKHAIRSLKKMKEAAPFLLPVDAVALGIPHYYNVVKTPMDLTTVERKLDSSNPLKPDRNASNPRYYHIDDFVKDVKLIFSNCVLFNGPEHPIAIMGKRVEGVFDKQIKQMPPSDEPKPISVPKPPPPVPPPAASVPPKVKPEKPAASARRSSTSVPVIRRSEDQAGTRPKREIHPPAPKDLPYADPPKKPRRVKSGKDDGTLEQLRFCSKLLNDLYKKQYGNFASPFYDPVDPVALNIPSYPKIIKKPMDMSTIKRKLDTREYSKADKFKDDFQLMLKNCFTFNPPGSPVYDAGVQLQKVFQEKWAQLPPLREQHSESEEEEDDDEDEDEDKARMVSIMKTQIELLKSNLAAIDTKKPKKDKKEKRRDKSHSFSQAAPSKPSTSKSAPSGKSSSKKSKKNDDGDSSVLSFEQKKDLSEAIGNLEGAKLEKVIQIIHEGVPEIRDSNEEIEVDIDSLPTSVLTKLYNLVLRPLRQTAPKRSRGQGGGTGGLKRKSMDEDAEAERIRKLEQRIALFDDKNGGGGGGAASNAPTSSRRDDDSVHSSDESSDDSSGSDSE